MNILLFIFNFYLLCDLMNNYKNEWKPERLKLSKKMKNTLMMSCQNFDMSFKELTEELDGFIKQRTIQVILSVYMDECLEFQITEKLTNQKLFEHYLTKIVESEIQKQRHKLIQFLVPIYLKSLVGLILKILHNSHHISKIIGQYLTKSMKM